MRRLAVAIVLVAVGSVAYVRRLVPEGESLLFFDGVCNLCDGFVSFVADHDSANRVRFGAIQRHGDLLRSFGAGAYAEGGSEALSTMVLVQESRVYVRSDAALRTISLLDSPLNAFAVFHLLPRVIRDAGYSLVAKYRYAIFGQTDECRPPDPRFERRFLDFVHI
ncbi:hypothetical protein CTAYLR_005860 [Chrysophaeum taylorii]|uniref:DUF393 domain-containing protein n=1 Tax=Chrysophaeum taylorii TaxID=2483200 RepID=A0AAD7UJH3_9STRA|nr:hypothetical protein CTAYLR_005860 [Chrysophaeum taylorii]